MEIPITETGGTCSISPGRDHEKLCRPEASEAQTLSSEPAPLSSFEAAIVRASMEGRARTLQTLLEKTTNLEIELADGWTPLMVAIWNNHLEAVKVLLEAGANPNAKSHLGHTPAMLAAWNGNLDIIRLLAIFNADLDAADQTQKTVLMWACHRGNFKIVAYLLQRGVNVNAENSKGMTAIGYAVRENHPEIVQLVQKQGSPHWEPHYIKENKKSGPIKG